MNLLTAAIGTAYAYAGDIPRALARAALDRAVDRALGLFASHRPTRTISSNAGDPYLGRSYLLGRRPTGFPKGLRLLLSGFDGTAFLHRFHRGDLEPEHHSHPWEWAVSVVLTGGYVEETVLADGTIVTRARPPGSVGVLAASSFHRVAELHAPHVWTLFIVGPRTPDSMWYFRRLNGEIVPHDVFIREREAERLGIRGRMAVVDDDGRAVPISEAAAKFDALVEPGRHGLIVSTPESIEEAIEAMMPHGWLRAADYLEHSSSGRFIRLVDTPKPVRGVAAPTWLHGCSNDMLVAMRPLVMIGVPVLISEAQPAAAFGDPILAGAAAPERGLELHGLPTALGLPVVQHWPAPVIEKRLTFEDGSVADLLADDPATIERGHAVRRRWRATKGENMAAQWVRKDLAQFERLARRAASWPAPSDLTLSPTPDALRQIVGGAAGIPRSFSSGVPSCDPDWSKRAPVHHVRHNLDGHTFEPMSPNPAIVIRKGDTYVGSLMSDGSSVRNGARITPSEIEEHAAAWEHARWLREAMEVEQAERRPGRVSLKIGPHGIPKVGPVMEET